MSIKRAALGLLVAVAVVAAACGNDDDAGSPGAQPTAEPTTGQTDGQAAEQQGSQPEGQAPASGQASGSLEEYLANAPELVMGLVLPESGALSYLYPPIGTGADLAIADVQAAGGKLKVLKGDSATDQDVAPVTVNRLLGEGAQVIVGAAASGVSQSFIQTLYETQVAQCSGSNTSAHFTTQSNAEYFVRTTVTTRTDAPVIADGIARGGASNVAVLARSDDWGQSLSELLAVSLDELNVASEVITFAPDSASFDDVVQEVSSMGADTVVLLAFAEGVQILRKLLEAGVPPSAIHVGPGLFDVELAEKVIPGNPEGLDGLRLYGASSGDDFNDRLAPLVGGNGIFGGQFYDCVVIMSLAALAAGTTSGPELIAVVPGLTRDGEKCTSYRECAELLAQGIDIDYDGASGPIELDDVGDPTVGRYAVAELRGGRAVILDIVDFVADG